MGIMTELQQMGINPFGVLMVAESLLKSSAANISAVQPLEFFFPVERKDCAGWQGVMITLQAVPNE
jgi:hypothetical protein